MTVSGRRQLEWSIRAGADLSAIDLWHAQFGEATAGRVMGEYPYTIVYRATSSRVRVVRVLHQRRAYFQRLR